MVQLWNVVKPSFSRKGKHTARDADGMAVRGGWRKRRSSGNQANRGCNITPRENGQTSIWCFMTREPEKLTKEEKQMTAARAAGAPSQEMVRWHAINWRAAHRIVSRLQARIVKATQDNRWGKVKALQHLLTHSFSGKVLAVKRVTENQGKRTAGVDKETWHTPDNQGITVAKPRPSRGVRKA